jgi:trigger factor
LKILKQEKKGNQVALEVEESYKLLEPHIQKASAEAAREIKVPGFRQGKVPAGMIDQYLNQEMVVDRALQMLISDIYPRLIDETKINPVDYPDVKVTKLDKGGSVVLEIKVDVYPDVKLGTYKGLKLKKPDVTVTDEEVTNTINYLKSGYAKQNNIPEADVVLDDEFAKKISTMGTFEELKTLIRSNIELDKKNDAESAIREEATKKLAEVVEADVPGGMVAREMEIMTNDLEAALKRNRMTLDSYLSAMKKDRSKLEEELKPSAEIRIKAKLALEKIAEKEKLAIGDEELDAELEALAQHTGKQLDEFKAEMSEEMKASVKTYMLNDKAMQFVIDKSKEESA